MIVPLSSATMEIDEVVEVFDFAVQIATHTQLITAKLVQGSRVGYVGPIDSCGQVGDLDKSLVNSHNHLRVGQVSPVNSCGQVRDINSSVILGQNDKLSHKRGCIEVTTKLRQIKVKWSDGGQF